MQKNDYRRSLILLRAIRQGMSGHVRLERRTLQATMRFTVQGPVVGRLQAVLLACSGGKWLAYPLGALTTDCRGQSGLTATFDPRNLNGLDLNQYALVAVVDEGNEPQVVLTGMVNGSREIPWDQALAAALAPYQEEKAPAPPAPQPEEPVCCCDQPEAPGEPAGKQAEETEEPEPERTAPESKDAEPEPETPEPEEEETPESKGQEPREAEASSPLTAIQALGLEGDGPWPPDIASLRQLFGENPPTDIFSLEDFVFVQAPLPREEGPQGICAIGLQAREGKPVSVCYALPGEKALEPPAGLEGYDYLGGWWYTVLQVQPEVNALGEEIGET